MTDPVFDKVAGGCVSAAAQVLQEGGASDADGAPDAADEVTGASPGTARACSEFGLANLADNLERLGIKPPGSA